MSIFAVQPSHAEDLLIDGVPLPQDTKTSFDKSQSGNETNWLNGIWYGAWGGQLKHILVVEDISTNGTASVVYSIGDFPSWGIKKSWLRPKAKFENGTLKLTAKNFKAEYKLSKQKKMIGLFQAGSAISQSVLTNAGLGELKTGNIGWTDGKSEMLETSLVEDGKTIRLETIIYKPKGEGPFPLAVVNHGSTGSGREPAIAKLTWSNTGLANYLVERGYLVAFPFRRGRGKSDGLYDEGFSSNRANGYSCSPRRSLLGADRALIDIEAAIAALQKRPDVKNGKSLMLGISRGGILASAYAGLNPDAVSGVVNFVGGWIGDDCKNAEEINGNLFVKAASYPKNMIWFYGHDDPFYDISHSKKTFQSL